MMGDIECLILLFEVPAMLQLKPWSASGASHHPLIWATVIHPFISLIHPVDEFCFKEMSTIRGKSKISSCCLCIWCKSKNWEAGGVQDSHHQWWKASLQIFFQL